MNGILENLDNIFKEKSENEKWMIILMIVAVIGYLAYSLLLPYAEEKKEQSEREKKALQKNIITHKQYIQSITVSGNRDFYITKYDNDVANLEKSIIKINDNINFISFSLEDLSPLLFNKKSWSKFLNSITQQAKNQQVEIDYIDNDYVDSNGSFGHILEISVGCKGEFKNIVKFINQLEKNVLVTDVYGSHIYMDENFSTTLADINISVWGVNH